MELLNGKRILGRPVKIKSCIPRTAAQAPPSGPPSTSSFVPNKWDRHDAHLHWKSVAREGRRVFVGGLPKPTSQNGSNDEIAKLFEGFAVEAISKVISPFGAERPQSINPSKNPYYAFVDLKSREETVRAIRDLDGAAASWGRITVRKAKDIPGDSWKVNERENFDTAQSEQNRP